MSKSPTPPPEVLHREPGDSPRCAPETRPAEDDFAAYSGAANNANIERHYTKEDAESLVGGQEVSVGDGTTENGHSSAAHGHEFFGQKVFLFSLPFGGLSSIRLGLKLPFVHRDEDPEIEDLRLRLERQQSVTTVDEARFFSSQKGTDDVRFRAMKQLIKENISDFLPEFIVKNKKPYEAVYSEISGPIVVLGGYRGLILRETATGKRAWVPLKAGLNLRKIRLLLGPLPEDELRATDLIYPDGILKNIGPFDICKRFLKKLDNGKTTITEFGYDWRLSLDITSPQLVDCLDKIYKDTGSKPIVIAHSMGGLVAHGAMQQRPDLFRGLVYVGVPSECFNILGPLRYGDLVMFSDRILTFETNFMMRSSFAFLPMSGRVFSNADTGELYDLDYFDPETWVEYNLNPLVSSARRAHELGTKEASPGLTLIETVVAEHHPVEEMLALSSPIGSIGSRIKQIQTGINRKGKITLLTNLQMQKRHKTGRLNPASPVDELMEDKFSFSFSEAYNYLSDTLARAKKFLMGLEYDGRLAQKYPPLAVVYGDKVPSVRGSYVKSRQDIKDGNYYHFYYGHGDGVVHQKWLMPENKGFEMHDPETGKGHIVGKFSSSAGHVNLMSDFEAMAGALSAIMVAEKNWHK
ncbi:hypothetical protein METBIDRAFT_78122 [Metschnikowia bicuspidata var. bicuspidata NRRL YB-4993]|uniref:Alpha/beta-hydrolase n=1 Tax=Metschnikowia bicuspidata var. bicuspidata NRRL YB-4993 TaxID=869754 RepID=A0A1A0HAX0_9ASCO|nr:hypothetical protein METBIDRAFT_78122 [Metschnikowia bicuspidata var. bicuspidata NRRL YB-4993]OBA21027.1 hypothetical protein METBIDRAFT_78122 [Metschnikowia bicuspidata var. bicuspidata NRRL YB-4993]